MNQQAGTAIAHEFQPDVVDYAARHDAEAYLPRFWEMTWRVFPGARQLRVYLEPDGDMADFSFVVFEVGISPYNLAELRASTDRWHAAWGECYPPPRSCPIILRVREAAP
jgi:hypothetical protein